MEYYKEVKNDRFFQKQLTSKMEQSSLHGQCPRLALSSFSRILKRFMLNPSQRLPDPIVDILEQIRNIYTNFFDQNWFTLFLDDFPMESGRFQDIRFILSLHEPKTSDIPILHLGISALETYIQLLKEIVIPKKSTIAPTYHPDAKVDAMPHDIRAQRKMIAYILPTNIKHLNSLVEELKNLLPPASSRPIE